MNKSLLLLVILAFFTRLEIKAQEGNQCPTPPPPGGESCQSSCVYCDFDGYMGINNGSPSGGNTVCGQIAIHNDQWFGFIAGTTSITMDIITSNCNNGDGLQSAFFDDCTDADAIVCNPGCGGCGGQTFSLTYSNFTPGETYWLMIDGYIGDVCDFEIDISDGSIVPDPPAPPSAPVGPQHVCPGATAVYTIPDATGAGYYHWTAPGGASINGLSNNVNVNAPEGTTVTVTFGTAGGNVCVQAGNSCFPLTPAQCIPVTNVAIPPTVKPAIVICNDDLPFSWDEDPFPTISSSGTFNLTSVPYDSYLGCDSLVKQTIIVKPPLITTLPTQYICNGDCFHLAGDNYCDPGPQSVVLQSFQGCDSLINFAISVLSPHAEIGGNSSITCNTPGGLTLSALNYVSGSTFQWTNANWNILGGAPTQNVSMTGTYHLVVSAIGGGVVCRDTTVVTVTGNTTPPGATATGSNINCISTTATLHGNSGTSGVNYLWTGPGISPANQNLQNPTVNVAGQYILTVTNPTNGCTSTATVTVMADNTPPSAGVVGGNITCLQSNVTLDGSTNIPNPTWNWAGPGINGSNQGTENPNVNVAGTYTVSVTNSINGCVNTATTTVIQDVAIPTASAGADNTLTCLAPSFNLQGSGNTGAAPMVVGWTGPNGFTSSILSPAVTDAGAYILTITNQANGCLKKDTVDIASNQVLPNASAGADSTINCSEPSVSLIGSGSSTGPNFTPLWSGPGINGSNQGVYNPVVNLPGTYTITITNSTSGCTSTDAVVVDINTTQPAANAGADQFLTCTNQNGVTLSGSGTPAGVTFLWSGPGIGANNEAQQSPIVTQSGTYTLQVTNPVNGCTHTDEVIVTQDANVPTADGGPDFTLNCTVNAVNFDGSGSTSGAGIVYSWTGPGISGGNSSAQSPSGITVPGTYNLTVTNTTNNCKNTDVVVVDIDTQNPTANGGADLILNCYNAATDTIDASGSSAGSIYTYNWSGPGITPANQNLQNPIINNQPGLYSLTVTNSDNTCTAVDQVQVNADLTAPTADAGTDKTIDCVVTSTLIGGASSSGNNFTYLWTGPGITPANEAQVSPNVALPGTYNIVVTNTVNGCTASNDVVVNTNAVFPAASAGPDGLLTCAVQNIVLDGSASSSGANFNVQWTGPGITPGNQGQASPSIATPGTYVVAITNTTNSCITKDTVVIAQNIVVPAASAGLDLHLDCQTTTVTLNGSQSGASPTITYLWTGPGITAAIEDQKSPQITMPGAYSILVTDTENGCSATDNVDVTQDIALPTASAGADLLITCANQTASINGSGSSTGANFTYVWQGSDINTNNFSLQNPMVSDSGMYIVTVTNIQNHCTSTDAVYVDMDKQAPVTAAGPDRTLTCAVLSVTLDGSGSQSGANISFNWAGPGIQSGQTTAMPVVNQPGSYNLTVTNSTNGCTATDFAIVGEDVLPPVSVAGSDLVITCANSATGVVMNSTGSSSGNGFTYNWSGPGITPANQSQANPTVLVPGSYTLEVTNSANGCTATDVVDVAQDQNLPVASAGADQTINCDILNVTLDASASTSPGGTLNYTWVGPGINAGNANSEMPGVSVSGTYTVTVLNTITGCAASDQVVVNLDNTPPVPTVTSDLITCQDPNGTLTVSSNIPGSTFLWEGPGVTSTNMTKATFTVADPGIYSVTVTAPNGCSATSTTTMQQDANVPDGTAEGATLNCYNDGTAEIIGNVNSPTGTTFVWNGPGIGTQTTGSVTVTQAGTYNFVMTTPAGCKKTIPVQVDADFTPPNVNATATDQLDCSTTQVTLNAGGTSLGTNFMYHWTTADGHIVAGATSLSPLVDAAGQYQLLVMNTTNGCADSVTVPVLIDPAVPTGFDLDIKDIVCFGDTDGSIHVNGVVGGTSPFNFTIESGSGTTTNQFTGLSAGDYTIMLVDANGCELDSTITIGEPGQLLVDLGPDIEIQLGETATVSAQITHTTPLLSVTWNYAPGCELISQPGQFCTEFTYPDSLLPLNSYRHTVMVVDSNGCRATDDVYVIVDKPRNVYAPNVFYPESIDPENSGFRLYTGFDVTKIQKLAIYDRWGNQVYAVKDIPGLTTLYGWDGKVRGDVGQVGVYVWYAVVEFIDGEVIEYKGDVTLVR